MDEIFEWRGWIKDGISDLWLWVWIEIPRCRVGCVFGRIRQSGDWWRPKGRVGCWGRMGMKGAAAYAGMVMAEFAQVGLMIASKAAISSGMPNLVFILYSNTLASLILLPSCLLFHRFSLSLSFFFFLFPFLLEYQS